MATIKINSGSDRKLIMILIVAFAVLSILLLLVFGNPQWCRLIFMFQAYV